MAESKLPAPLRVLFNSVFALVAALALGACATANVQKSYTLSSSRGTGVVVGSITSAGLLADYRIYYRKIGGGEEGFFQLKSDDPSLNGALVVAELPAGDYEIYNWFVRWRNSDTLPKAPVSIRFHVGSGEAVYIGSCGFDLATRMRSYYDDVPVRDARVVCRDEAQRDLAEVEARYPGLKSKITSANAPSDQIYSSNGFRTSILDGDRY